MGKKILRQEPNLKIQTKETSYKACAQIPSFSFQHLTSNKKYNFSYYDSKTLKKNGDQVKANLYNKLEEICKFDWAFLGGMRKKTGLETLHCDQINFLPTNFILPKDEKLIVFRFKGINNDDYRMIGFRKNNCPTYYIIGFDFNFKAYPHG